MGIKIKRAANKKGYRANFFMVYRIAGKKNPVEKEMYGYPVRGTPPASLSIFDKGDETYERSKVVARERFDQMMKDMEVKGGVESMMERVVASKLGKEKIEYVTIRELYDKWTKIQRGKDPTKARMNQAKNDFKMFADFMGKKRFLYEITEEHVSDYYKHLQKTYAPATVRDKMSLLRSTVGRYLPSGLTNPFKTICARSADPSSDRISHHPLSPDEYSKVLAAVRAEGDQMMIDLAVGCGETGMRIKDVCLLTWNDVDLKKQIIRCATHKTGTKVVIPISKELEERLRIAEAKRSVDSQYIWPDAATMYNANPSGICYRGKRLFAKALFDNCDEEAETVLIENGKHKQMTILEAEDIIKKAKYQAKKKENILKVIWGRHDGKSSVEIARESGLSKGQVSEYLKEIFEDFGIDYRPKITPRRKTLRMLKKTRQERTVGINSGCIYGWHSFRSSFVAKAVLFWKFPAEYVRMVVGHKATETTLRYYLNPTDPIMMELKAMMDADVDRRMAKHQIIVEGASPKITEEMNPRLIEDAEPLKLVDIMRGLSEEEKGKVRALDPEAKAEFRKVTSVEDARNFLMAF